MNLRPSPRRRFALGLALAAALGLAWAAGRRETREEISGADLPWPDPPRLRLDPGVEVAYTLEVRSEGWIDAGQGGAGHRLFSAETHGLLVLRPYPGSGDSQEVGARLLGARLTIDGQVPFYAAALDTPFSFRLDGQGRFTALAFSPRLPPEAAVVLEQLLSRLQVVLPHERRSDWRTRERDAAGVFRAGYRVDPAAPLRVEKRKLEYLPVEGGGDPPPEVVESRTILELEPGLGGVRRVEGAELLRRQAGTLEGRERVQLRYERTAAPGALPGSLAELRRVRDEAGAPAPTEEPPPPPEVPGVEAAGALFRRFDAAFREDRTAAEALAAAWLRQRGAPGELVRQLDAMDGHPAALDPAERSVLWRLLAQASTPEAEAALLDAAVGSAHPLLTRRQAVGHFGEVAVARPHMVEGLLGLYDVGRAAPPGEVELGSMALRAVGSLGHPGLADPALARTVAEALEARLARAADPAGRAEVLEAMGNAGAPCLAALRAALDDPDPSLRATAAGAFRRMEGPEGRRTLLAHAAAEPHAPVRARVVEVLQRLEPDREVIAWAAAEVAVERDRGVLLALVDLLGTSSRRSPEARAALSELLQRGGDRAVEQRALRYVPPPPRGGNSK